MRLCPAPACRVVLLVCFPGPRLVLCVTVQVMPDSFPPSPYWPEEDVPSPPLPALTAAVPPAVPLGAPRPVGHSRTRLVVAAVLVLIGVAAVWLPTAHERYSLEQVSSSVTPLVWEVSCTTFTERHRGTGFVVYGLSGPFLLTNWHVVDKCGDRDSPTGIIEVGRPGEPPQVATLVEFFEDVDAAVLSSAGLPPGLRLGPPPAVGDLVAVVGHPGDSRDVHVSGRVVETGATSFVVAVEVEKGSSGSPALAADGRVVGLVSAKLVGGFRDAAQVFSLGSVCSRAVSC